MPAIAAWAPGKIILFGEHAVVYHRPAIAVPVTDVQARAVILPNPLGQPGSVQIDAPDIGLNALLSELPPENPLATSILAVQEQLGISSLPAFKIRITSTIPIAAGLGSGAAISAAIARAVSNFLGHPLSDSQVSDIAYRVDQYYHGTPSGIDNTVIAHNRPVYFVRGQPFQTLRVVQPFTLVIGNSGLPSPTGTVVGDLRARYEADPAAYEPIFNHIGAIAEQARGVIEQGDPFDLGPLLTANHAFLHQLGVSCPELNRLVTAALAAGALGAKLSGGGRGGNMIALVEPELAEDVSAALRAAGAVHALTTVVQATP